MKVVHFRNRVAAPGTNDPSVRFMNTAGGKNPRYDIKPVSNQTMGTGILVTKLAGERQLGGEVFVPTANIASIEFEPKQ